MNKPTPKIYIVMVFPEEEAPFKEYVDDSSCKSLRVLEGAEFDAFMDVYHQSKSEEFH